MKGSYFAIILIVLLILGGSYYVFSSTYIERHQAGDVASTTPGGSLPVTYECQGARTFDATFSTSSVFLKLSDGRSFVLPQARAGSGMRYEGTSTPVFVGKGNDAFIEEGGVQTYTNCVVNATPSSSSESTYTFSDNGKMLRFTYPNTVTVSGAGIGYSTAWQSGATTSGLVLVKVVLPKTFQPHTNFSEGTFTVGTSADPAAVSSCTTSAYGTKTKVTINGAPYTRIVSSDAGAGNFYETTSYRTIRNSQCYTIEYTIHSTNIGNYSPDQGITAFDNTAVTTVFEGIVHSLTFL